MLKRVWAFLMAPGTTLAFATVILVGLGVDGHRGLGAAMMFLVVTLAAENTHHGLAAPAGLALVVQGMG